MVILFWRELVASKHSGWKSRVRDTTVHRTLCVFGILIDNAFLPIYTKKNVCFSVDGSFVPVGHVSCTWHGQKSTVRDQRHGAPRSCGAHITSKQLHAATEISQTPPE